MKYNKIIGVLLIGYIFTSSCYAVSKAKAKAEAKAAAKAAAVGATATVGVASAATCSSACQTITTQEEAYACMQCYITNLTASLNPSSTTSGICGYVKSNITNNGGANLTYITNAINAMQIQLGQLEAINDYISNDSPTGQFTIDINNLNSLACPTPPTTCGGKPANIGDAVTGNWITTGNSYDTVTGYVFQVDDPTTNTPCKIAYLVPGSAQLWAQDCSLPGTGSCIAVSNQVNCHCTAYNSALLFPVSNSHTGSPDSNKPLQLSADEGLINSILIANRSGDTVIANAGVPSFSGAAFSCRTLISIPASDYTSTSAANHQWYLPAINELKLIYNVYQKNQSTNLALLFPSGMSTSYWSSTDQITNTTVSSATNGRNGAGFAVGHSINAASMSTTSGAINLGDSKLTAYNLLCIRKVTAGDN